MTTPTALRTQKYCEWLAGLFMERKYRWNKLVCAISIVSLLNVGAKGGETGETYVVTNLGGTGSNTLSWAIGLADANPGSTVDITTSGTISLSKSLYVDASVTIEKTGTGAITVSGRNSMQDFVIDNAQNVNITNISIIDGLAKGTNGSNGGGSGGGGGGGGGLGGGIFVNKTAGTITLTNVTFRGNKAQGGNGGNGATYSSSTEGAGGKGGIISGTVSTLSSGNNAVFTGGTGENNGNGASSQYANMGNGGGGGGGSTASGNGGGIGGDGGFGAGAGGGGGIGDGATVGLGGPNTTNNSFNGGAYAPGVGGNSGTGTTANSGAGGGGGGGSGYGAAFFIAPGGSANVVLDDSSIDNTNTVLSGTAGTSKATLYGAAPATNGAALGGATMLTEGIPALVFGGTSTATISSPIDGDGTDNGIVKQGTGILILTASNGYSGDTYVNGGTLQIGDGVTPGASIANAGSGLSSTGGGSGTLDPVFVASTGTLAINLLNNEQFTNGIAVDGVVKFIANSGTTFLAGVISDYNNPGTGTIIQSGSGTTQLTAGANNSVNNASGYEGSQNSFTGVMEVTDGKLQAGDIDVMTSGSVTVAAGAIFDLNGFSQSIGSLSGSGTVYLNSVSSTGTLTTGNDGTNTTFSGVITDGSTGVSTGGVLKMIGTGLFTLTGSSSYTGLTEVGGGGTLQIGDGKTPHVSIYSSNAGGAVQVSNASNLNIDLVSGESFQNDVNLTGGSFLYFMASGTNTISGAISDDSSGAIVQSGSGKTVYTGDGSGFSGSINLNAGTFQIGDGVTPGTNLGGNISFTGSSTLLVNMANGGTVEANVDLSGSNIINFVASGTNFATGAFSDDGTGIINQKGKGTTVYSGDGSGFSGRVNVTAGAFQIGDDGVTPSANLGGNVTVSASATLAVAMPDGSTLDVGQITLTATSSMLNFTGSNLNAYTVPSNIIGKGSVLQNNINGTTTLTGSNSYTGPTNINAGVLQDGNPNEIPTTSAVTVGAAGVLDLNSNNQALASLSGNGYVTIESATLQIGGINTSSTFSGVIDDSGDGGELDKVGTGNFTLTGANVYAGTTVVDKGTLTLGNGSTPYDPVVNSSEVDVNAKAALFVNLGNGVVFDNNVVLSSGTLNYNVPAGATNLFTGSVAADSGSDGVFNKTGAGVLIYTGQSSQLSGGFSGRTNVTAGTLQIGDNGATIGVDLDQSVINVSGSGTLAVALADTETLPNNVNLTSPTARVNSIASGSITIAGKITGPGGLLQSGSGTTFLTGSNTYSGPTTVTNGTLLVSNSGASATGNGAVSVNGGGFGGTGLVGGMVTVGNGAKLLPAVNQDSNPGVLTLRGGLTLSNGSTLDEALGVNAPNSPLLVIGGSFTTHGTNSVEISLSQLSGLTAGTYELIKYNGVILGSGTSAFQSNPVLIPGSTEYLGKLVFSNRGYVDIAVSPLQIWTGTGDGTWNTVSAGNWTPYPSGVYSNGNDVVFDDTSSTYSPSGTTNVNLTTLVAPDSVSFSNNTLTYKLSGSGGIGGNTGLSMDGNGLVILTTSNSYTGSTTINAGTFQLGDGVTPGATIFSSGTVNVANRGALAIDLVGGETFKNGVADNGLVNTIASGVNTLSGTISGSGRLLQSGSGTTILTGSNTYTGATLINAGTLQIGNGATGLINPVSSVSVQPGATLALDLATGGTYSNRITDNGVVAEIASGTNTVTAPISGSGNFNQNGTGVTVLTGTANLVGGSVNVNAGTLAVGPASLLADHLNISSGLLETAGRTFAQTIYANSLTIGSTGTLSLGLIGTNPLLDDHVVVTGSITLGGTLNLYSKPGFQPRLGESFLITGSSGALIDSTGLISGSFSNVTDNFKSTLIPELIGNNTVVFVQGPVLDLKRASTLTPTVMAVDMEQNSQNAQFLSNGNDLGAGFSTGVADSAVSNGVGVTMTTPVPEPSSIALIGGGLLMAGAMLRRRRIFTTPV